ncbi:hypothetical protein L0P88_13090 [Muricauda sp. SCSIO 64092]|uniref:hypothetical protein n=1 Tax=Allomuricauda sp. SCSIO 64092 TaxID=2908842 RepID=UPI001FF1F43C|nr:hypothetical protein [Muricauda sp. SCSIO 64092]UOY04888.1 hypothetical protein L0P88_13090 [Muricauda sp. SCSIO 64092]
MKYRKFGHTGWKVSEIGYGMWGMAEWTGYNDKQSIRSLQKAVDLGCDFLIPLGVMVKATVKNY